MSAIADISRALSYDAVETMIMVPGSLYSGRVLAVAVAMLDAIDADDAPISAVAPTEALTVAPGAK